MRSGALGALDSLIDEAMAEWQVPGLAVAVVDDDGPVLLKAYGLREVEAALPVTVDTQFLLGSITKTFTAVGLGMLVDQRRLDWTKPVREYIPEFRLHDPIAGDRVTVQDLLCHHSGLPRHDWIWIPGDRSQDDMLAALRHLEPSRDLRAAYQYCNLGFMVAGIVAERITGQSWEDFTRERLLTPLGMTHVGFSTEALELATDSARPYVVSDSEDPSVFVRHRARLWPVRTTPAGGINAAISDMARYLRFHLAGGRCGKEPLLSPQTLRALHTPRVHAGRSEFDEIGDLYYGLGLSCHHYRGERVVGHSGGWIGWSTLLAMLPDRRAGVVILTNGTPSPITDLVSLAVFDRLCGKEPINWLTRFREQRRMATATRVGDRDAHRRTRKSGAAPTHPLTDYAGEYDHPGYGRISIECVDDALRWRFHGLSGTLVHRHWDVFEVPADALELLPGLLPIAFAYDREGNINRLSAPFEPMVADIVFIRIAGGDSVDPAFRATCVGNYQRGATRHVVAIDSDGQLTLSPTGQPTYRLMPYQGRTFAIRDLDGLRIEFQRAESGIIDTIVFHQPNGTFVARRDG